MEDHMSRIATRIAWAMLVCFSVGTTAFAQTGINATLSGTVSDPTGALIPGVEITAKNVDTGVTATSVTNESGTYRFASLQPGNYELNAALPGFQQQKYRLNLGTSQQIRQNFTLQVGAVSQTVEVTVAADELLTASTASVGTVLPASQLVDLPLVTRNVMDLAMTLPGVTGEGGANTTFGGVSANGSANVGISLDGVTMNTGRHTQGLKTTFFVNPDMIEEMRVTVAPVDVEGRGAAQVAMRARAGTNQFRGAATWNLRNSALNANSWSANRLGSSPIWYNRHQTTASLGGPVIKNKTFFFALYDRMDQLQKESVNGLVLTPLARQGIFRFFPGINNGNADTTPSGTGATRIAPVVDKLGNPLAAPVGATGPMVSFNVFGDSLNPGDPLRRRLDPSGYMTNFLKVMPLPNAYDGTIGDGLNTERTSMPTTGNRSTSRSITISIRIID
jgi:Carboxypeptidase regulatory-like domain/TonB-dependent Receptor Plug Domain